MRYSWLCMIIQEYYVYMCIYAPLWIYILSVMLFCLTCTNRHHVFFFKVVAPEILPAGGSTSGSRCEAKVSNGLLDEAMAEIKELLPLLVECLGEQDWSMMYYFSVIGDMGRLNPYHPWDWYIYFHRQSKSTIHVGKYTIHGWYGKQLLTTKNIWKIQKNQLEKEVMMSISIHWAGLGIKTEPTQQESRGKRVWGEKCWDSVRAYHSFR